MIGNEMVQKASYFSFAYAFYNTAWWLGWYVSPLRRICTWGFKHKDRYVKSYLYNRYAKIIEEYRLNEGNEMIRLSLNEYPIWVFWYQGFEYAPPLVRACFENLKRKNKNVIAIDKNNLDEYVRIPSFIKNKVDKGKITFTHYSDIIRVALLSEHGGLWVDSTCFTSVEVSENVKQSSFFSSKTINKSPLPLWSNSRWCGWGQGTCYKNYPLFVFLRDMLYAYWEKEEMLIDYLLLDALMELGLDENKMIHSDMDSLPENNLQRNKLWGVMNRTFSENEYRLMTEDTWLFKLSYKTNLVEKSNTGEATYYKRILDQDLN